MPEPQTEYRVVSFGEARQIVETHARTISASVTEDVALLATLGRVLAADVLADRDFPPFDRSTRDGFAVRSSDVQELPAKLRVVGEIRAGELNPFSQELAPGECAEIMTGAPVPTSADAVLMVEYTEREGDSIDVKRSVIKCENIVPRGDEARAGAVMLKRGTRVDYAAIAAAASVGSAQLPVIRKPRVAVLSTGDEVVDISRTPGINQIRNSNSFSVAAQVAACGGEPVVLPIAPDEPVRLRELIAEGLRSDLLLLTGGVSMGKYDLVETVLAEFDARFHFTGVRIQPGKPLVFGDARSEDGTRKYFFGLPGNPISTMATFELFVRTMLDALSGASPRNLVFPLARMRGTIRGKTGLTRFVPARLCGTHERPQIEMVGWHGSGDVAAAARANCFAVIGEDVSSLGDGELIPVLLRGLEI